MKKFKIQKTWIVEATDEAEALKAIQQDGLKYLRWLSVSEAEASQSKGWVDTAKRQLTGK